MPRITPVHWRLLEKIFLKDGFVFARESGDHRAYVKDGILRPVNIPRYDEIDKDIILSNMKTARMSRERYFELLKECK